MENPRNRADLYKKGVTKNCIIKYLFILKRKERIKLQCLFRLHINDIWPEKTILYY